MNSIVIIILGIIVIILLFVLYVYFTSSVSPLIKYVNLNDTPITSIPYSSITNPLSTRFAYSVWIYVNSWKNLSTTNTNVFYRHNEVGISFDKTRPILYCNFNNDNGEVSNKTTTIIVSNNFPIQTWTNVILNIDNNYLDVYINGQLVRSNVLSDQYTQLNQPNDIKIGDSKNGSDIYLANLKRWGGSINPQTAYYDYLSGLQQLPADSSTYNFKLSLLKDNNLLQSLKL